MFVMVAVLSLECRKSCRVLLIRISRVWNNSIFCDCFSAYPCLCMRANLKISDIFVKHLEGKLTVSVLKQQICLQPVVSHFAISYACQGPPETECLSK